jgi:hypothetical protein
MVTISLEEKYELLRRHDELLAYEVAKNVIEKPKASIWIIFMPIFLVFHAQRMQKYKKSVHAFARHFLHTKLFALNEAREEAITGRPPNSNPADPPQNLGDSPGSAEIRARQLREIGTLKEHYLLLLQSPGESYSDLLKNTYKTGGDYRFFLNKLSSAEMAVNEAVITFHHSTPEASDIVARMVEATEKRREREREEIFG